LAIDGTSNHELAHDVKVILADVQPDRAAAEAAELLDLSTDFDARATGRHAS
jgi:hypothetical protein